MNPKHLINSVATIVMILLTGILWEWQPPAQGNWQSDLDRALEMNSGKDRDSLVKKIAEESPDWKLVMEHIQKLSFVKPEKTGDFFERMMVCKDGVERPYIVYVPGSYEPEKQVPLLIYLHGGVSRPEIYDNRLEYVKKNEFIELAAEKGWMMVFPYGQAGATWWDDVGMTNIRAIVRKIKSQYNVDDDRIWMTGFSDGGSASYLFASVYADDLAACVPLNGHMGVGSLDGKLPVNPANMKMTSVYAVNTDIDELYPGKEMRRMVDFARQAGADIIYREYAGIGHDFDYAVEEVPRIGRFLERHPRDPFPHCIEWRSATADFGMCRWFRIDRVDPVPAAQWHTEPNLELVDDKVAFGFFSDDKFEGKGVKISKLAEGETLASRLGLKEQDIIVRCGEMKIESMDDLTQFKQSIHRGDRIEVRVERMEEKLVLTGEVPGPETYFLFPVSQPFAAARVNFEGNVVKISGSRVGGFSVFVHPDMFQLASPIKIEVDGNTVFNEIVRPDVEFMLNNFMENRDRKTVFVAKIQIQ